MGVCGATGMWACVCGAAGVWACVCGAAGMWACGAAGVCVCEHGRICRIDVLFHHP